MVVSTVNMDGALIDFYVGRETLFQFKDTSIKNKNDSFHIQ